MIRYIEIFGGIGGETGLYIVPIEKDSIHEISPRIAIRKLTPIECERLQGFPDDWTSNLNESDRYRLLGKSATVGVIETIGKRLKER